MTLASSLYGRVARARRAWYVRRPWLRHRLGRPVISVGNMTVGGTGKTPTIAHLASLLIAMGERPALLSRGYARQENVDGVVVVGDGHWIRADVRRAGDEPLMLARAVPGAAVVVSPDRFLAGRLAEFHLGCTVHLLDDGFQHLPLERDVDLLIVEPADIERAHPLPAGRLREPLDTAAGADAVIVPAATPEETEAVAGRIGVRPAFRLVRISDTPRLVEPPGREVEPAAGTRVVAVSGIARPEPFFADLRAAGWVVVKEMAFADHHPFTAHDVARIARAAGASRAVMVITTEKDLMRLLPMRPLPILVAWVPLRVTIEPAAEFQAWLAGRLADARRQEHRVER